jgi:hypothetical protein
MTFVETYDMEAELTINVGYLCVPEVNIFKLVCPFKILSCSLYKNRAVRARNQEAD